MRTNERTITTKSIVLWVTLLGIGIIGTFVSLQMIPIYPIFIVLVLILTLYGFIVHESFKKCNEQNNGTRIEVTKKASVNSRTRIKDNSSLAYLLIFIGFTLAWMIAWFVLLCYFRYSTYMLTVYL
jgi:hypothetical protein